MGELLQEAQAIFVILSILAGGVIWVAVRTERNSSRIEHIRDRLKEHLDACAKSNSDIFSILNEVRGDVREIKGEIKHAKCLDPPD